MNTVLQHQYLEAMGVQVWRERIEHNESMACSTCADLTFSASGTLHSVVCIDEPIDSKAQLLLSNILSTIKVELPLVSQTLTCSNLSHHQGPCRQLLLQVMKDSGAKYVLAFGGEVTKRLIGEPREEGIYPLEDTNVTVIVAPTLSALQHERQLKKTLWDHLVQCGAGR